MGNPGKKKKEASGHQEALRIWGASQHNLKGISCVLPRNALVAITGPSGSGKSSLVFGTIYQEAQRRFLNVFRQRGANSVSHAPTPNVDAIEGLSFCVAIEKRPLKASFATLATFTECYDYLKLLFHHLGTAHCTECEAPLRCHSRQDMIRATSENALGEQIWIMGPLGALSYQRILSIKKELLSLGFSRIRVDGEWKKLGSQYFEEDLEQIASVKEESHSYYCEVVVDSFVLKESSEVRLIEALELAMNAGGGDVLIEWVPKTEQGKKGVGEDRKELRFSEVLKCRQCEEVQIPLRIGEYSYFRPEGWCSRCQGSGFVRTPADKSSKGNLVASIHKAKSKRSRRLVETYLGERICPECLGSRVAKKARLRSLHGRSFAELLCSPISEALVWAKELKSLPEFQNAHSSSLRLKHSLGRCISECESLLFYLSSLGLGYLEPMRSLSTLSSGEVQRAHLARELRNEMSGVVYLIDEPSTGLHPADLSSVVAALKRLVAVGASVVMVEHDLQLIHEAEYVLDMGPGAGFLGGEIIACGRVEDIIASGSITGEYLKQDSESFRLGNALSNSVELPSSEKGQCLVCRNATLHNLKGIDVSFPLGRFSAVAGVSGSGKSSLLTYSVVPAVRELLRNRKKTAEVLKRRLRMFGLEELEGWESLSFVVDFSERRRGVNNRSTVATASGIAKLLAQMFARTIEARVGGCSSRAFLFNDQSGWCEQCRGTGVEPGLSSEHSDMRIPCSLCAGGRFKAAIERIHCQELSISEAHNLSVDQCLDRFSRNSGLVSSLEMLREVGLGYLKLSQSTSSLSLGEWQRLRLARDLGTRRKSSGVYVFDEPTRGLHSVEVDLLLSVLRRLTERGDTVVVIEHNTNLLARADYLVELGPGAGSDGGNLIASGTPGEIRKSEQSVIGAYL